MAVSKQPSITPETSSGEGLDEEPTSRGEAKWKRFHPFRVVRKIFRRRVKRQGAGEKTSKKSWSTSELQSVRDTQHKYEVPSPPYKIGLSVSHDSIFSSESSNVVGHEEFGKPQSSSLSVQHAGVKNMFKDELFSRVHARRDSDDDDDEDIGLPHSPCTSPTTADILSQGLKSKPSKSGSLSAGSLISMGSSENDEDSAVASSSGNSSRMSLMDRRSLDFEGDPDLHQVVPLNHQAAHHKIAVRPKRKHGVPQKRLKQKVTASKVNTLPTTPEVTEDLVKVYLKSKTSESSSMVVSHESLSSVIAATLLENSIGQGITASSKEIHMEKSSNHTKISQFQVTASEKSFQSSEVHSKTDIEMSTQNSTNLIALNMFGIFKSPCDPSSTSAVTQDINNIILDNMQLSKEVSGSVSDTFAEANSSGININMKEIHFSRGDSSLQTAKNDNQMDALQQVTQFVSDRDKNIEHDSVTIEPGNNVNSKMCKKQSDFNFGRRSSQENSTKSIDRDREISTIENIADCSNFHTNDRNFNEPPCSTNSCVDDLANQAASNSNEKKQNGAFSSDHFSNERQLEMEIRQEFEHQKADKNEGSTARIMSRLFPEEESIMSEKCVLPHSMDKNNVIISHHITETCNLVASDKIVSVNQNIFTSDNSSTRGNINEASCMGSDFSNLPHNVSNVMISPLSPNSCNQGKTDEKVIVSVKHMKEQIKSIEPKPMESHHAENITKKPKLIPLVLSAAGESNKVESTKPNLKVRNKMTNKSSDSAKRVSVEIVPFNQRLKDGKYQPLLFQDKDSSNNSVKDSSTTLVVERNFSERRVNSRNKDAGNNRHSFSGALSTDIERPVEKKQVSKPAVDNLHYPVQIRIHKSKAYEKENLGEKAKTNKEIMKSPSPERLPDSKQASSENQAKWEVRVQSTSLTRNESLKSSSSDVCQDESLMMNKSDQDNISPSSNESSLSKSRENTRKTAKESGTSDDPEPELLRVFARRSIKQKHCDKDKPSDKKEVLKVSQPSESKGALKDVDQPSPITRQPAIKHLNVTEPFVSTLKSPELVKKKSKSFCEKEKNGPHISPSAKDITINRRPSLKVISPQTHEIENFHRRQRVASEPDAVMLLPSLADNVINNRTQQSNISCENALSSCHNEHLMHAIAPSSSSTLSNGSSPDTFKLKENTDVLSRDPNAPSWLQLAQQRRELREQRERLLIGSSTNSFLEASGKPSRSSKVWDMVNNFQKLQMT